MDALLAGPDTLPCSVCFGPTDPDTGRCRSQTYPGCDRAREGDVDAREYADDAEIEAAMAADPDFPEFTDEDLRNAVAVSRSGRVKRPIYIRLDEEILEYYQSSGPRYQTRINSDLLTLVREKKHGRLSSAYMPSSMNRTRLAKGTWHGTTEAKARKRGAPA